MKIIHHNRGLFTNKIHVSTMLKDAPKIGILALSETHTNEEHATSVFNIQGFSFVSRPRRNGKGGGIAMYLSDKISWERRSDLEVDKIECLWIEIIPTIGKHLLLLVLFYF